MYCHIFEATLELGLCFAIGETNHETFNEEHADLHVRESAIQDAARGAIPNWKATIHGRVPHLWPTAGGNENELRSVQVLDDSRSQHGISAAL